MATKKSTKESTKFRVAQFVIDRPADQPPRGNDRDDPTLRVEWISPGGEFLVCTNSDGIYCGRGRSQVTAGYDYWNNNLAAEV